VPVLAEVLIPPSRSLFLSLLFLSSFSFSSLSLLFFFLFSFSPLFLSLFD